LAATQRLCVDEWAPGNCYQPAAGSEDPRVGVQRHKPPWRSLHGALPGVGSTSTSLKLPGPTEILHPAFLSSTMECFKD